jgi:guanine nucleotide-binding protein G(i) subunit alpha
MEAYDELTSSTAGAADSGKSTIVKQMQIIHHGGFPDAERRRWKNIIFRNLVDSFSYLLDKIESQRMDLEDGANMVRAIFFP